MSLSSEPYPTDYTMKDEASDAMRSDGRLLLANVDKAQSGDRKALMRALDGQKAVVSDSLALLPGWECLEHPEVDVVNSDIDEWLKHVQLPDQLKSAHRSKGDWALLTAAIFPSTSTEKWVVLTKCMYWVFIFDDYIDAGGSMCHDTARTQALVAETKACIDACLLAALKDHMEPVTARGPITTMLQEPLLAMGRDMALDAKARLRSDLIDYVDSVAQAQRLGAAKLGLPQLELFLLARRLWVGVRPFLSMSEYAGSFSLPSVIHEHGALKEIVELSVELLMLVNELHSVQKEAADGQLENLMLLLTYYDRCSLAEAVEKLLDMLTCGYASFNAAEARTGRSLGGFDAATELKVLTAKRFVAALAYWE